MNKIFVISDINGYLKEFKELLKESEYDPKSDKLICLGGYYGDGPNEIELIDFLSELSIKNNAIILCNNADRHFIKSLNSTKVPDSPTIIEYLRNKEKRLEHTTFFAYCEDFAFYEDYLFGYNPKKLKAKTVSVNQDKNTKTPIIACDEQIFLNFKNEKLIGLIEITTRKAYYMKKYSR